MYTPKASLKYGKFVSKWIFFVLLLSIMSMVWLNLITLLLLKAEIVSKNISIDLLIAAIFCTALLLTFFTITVVCITRNHKVLLWTKSAVVVKANIKKFDEDFSIFAPNRIVVTFTFNKKKIKRISSSGNCFIGYAKFFIRYVGDNVNILYSPIYDEVIFI